MTGTTISKILNLGRKLLGGGRRKGCVSSPTGRVQEGDVPPPARSAKAGGF